MSTSNRARSTSRRANLRGIATKIVQVIICSIATSVLASAQEFTTPLLSDSPGRTSGTSGVPCFEPGCKWCLDGWRCDVCEDGFALTPAGQCIPCSQIPLCDRCKWSNDSGLLCTSCAKGHGPSAKAACLPCRDDGCRICTTADSPGSCTKCYEGFVLDPDSGKCKPCESGCIDCTFRDWDHPSWCNECEPGKGHNPGRDDCSACPGTNCLTCDLTKNAETCTSCRKGYGFAADNPATCVKCSDSQCETCGHTPVGKEICTTCNEPYRPDRDGKCVRCGNEQCLKCGQPDGPRVCLTCKDGSYPGSPNGDCISCGIGCQRCSQFPDAFDFGKCRGCLGGFMLENGKCVSLISTDP